MAHRDFWIIHISLELFHLHCHFFTDMSLDLLSDETLDLTQNELKAFAYSLAHAFVYVSHVVLLCLIVYQSLVISDLFLYSSLLCGELSPPVLGLLPLY